MIRGGACIGAVCAALLLPAPVCAGDDPRLPPRYDDARGAKAAESKTIRPKAPPPRRAAPPLQWGDGSCRPYPVCSSNGCRILPPPC